MHSKQHSADSPSHHSGGKSRKHAPSHHSAASEREAGFEQTMEHVRKEIPRSTRPFSRFIHSPAIERISDILASTIFRPTAILAGGVTAFVGVLGLYFYAKYAGFTLQGSETIVAFTIGWLVGILIDFFNNMIRGGR